MRPSAQIFKTLIVAGASGLAVISALDFDRVLCSAGKRGWDIALDPRDLTRLTVVLVANIRAL